MKTKKKSGKNLTKSGKSRGKIREFDRIKKVGTLILFKAEESEIYFVTACAYWNIRHGKCLKLFSYSAPYSVLIKKMFQVEVYLILFVLFSRGKKSWALDGWKIRVFKSITKKTLTFDVSSWKIWVLGLHSGWFQNSRGRFWVQQVSDYNDPVILNVLTGANVFHWNTNM